MDLKSLSLPERLAAGAGCVAVLAVMCGAVLYGAFEFRATSQLRADLEQAPVGWADSLRAYGQSPDLSGLVAARTDAGDGAAEAHDTTRAWRLPGIETAYRAMTGGAAGATSVDSAIWNRVDQDTSLERFVRLARRREWRALDAVLAGAGEGVRRNVLALPVPKYGDLRNACRALVVRAVLRVDRGDEAGARADLGAAVAIGEQLFRREPSLLGSAIGRSIVGSAANGWLHFARTVHDTALAERARAARDWAGVRPTGVSALLLAASDTALAFARDTTLTLGMRGEALIDILLGYLVRPRGSVFGVPGRYRQAFRELGRDPDPDFARLATMTAATAERVHFRGLGELIREAQPGTAR